MHGSISMAAFPHKDTEPPVTDLHFWESAPVKSLTSASGRLKFSHEASGTNKQHFHTQEPTDLYNVPSSKTAQIPKLHVSSSPCFAVSSMDHTLLLGEEIIQLLFTSLFLQHLLMPLVQYFYWAPGEYRMSLQITHQPSMLPCTLQKPFEGVLMASNTSPDGTSTEVQTNGQHSY